LVRLLLCSPLFRSNTSCRSRGLADPVRLLVAAFQPSNDESQIIFAPVVRLQSSLLLLLRGSIPVPATVDHPRRAPPFDKAQDQFVLTMKIPRRLDPTHKFCYVFHNCFVR
jgi:hypothetical protein